MLIRTNNERNKFRAIDGASVSASASASGICASASASRNHINDLT